ncbi:MAG: transposase [Candidatus Dadabacteria bacterium]|nr:transposase [Candidatus Dadabacteria bacterium]
MSKLTRYNIENHVYFVTSKTKNNKPIFLNPANADLFIQTLFECRNRYRFLLLGFVVMPDHFHALIMPKHGYYISSVVQKIKSLFAYRMRGLGIKGSIWQKSFYDFVVYSEEKCREKLDYIHANPVRKGIVNDPMDYRFSSVNHQEKMDMID